MLEIDGRLLFLCQFGCLDDIGEKDEVCIGYILLEFIGVYFNLVKILSYQEEYDLYVDFYF